MLRTVPVGREDEPFLFQVYTAARRDEVAAWGWDAAQQEAFLRMQFRIRQRGYAGQYPDADHRIIWYRDQRVGYLVVARTATEIRLVDIALLPEVQGMGIGSGLIGELQAEAAGMGKPLRLSVWKTNPARRLYKRLGFVVVAESDAYDQMEWRPRSR